MASKRFQPTSHQIALSQEREAKKQKQNTATNIDDKGRIASRAWITLQEAKDTNVSQRIKVLTWNLLAQCLIRRELFPTSDCLKASQREHMLYREILAQGADIMCLQEVDRLEKVLPVLEDAGYSHHYAAGPKKNHGCLVTFRKNAYAKIAERLIQYDEEDVRQEGDERARRGSSFRTQNIGSLVALQSFDDESKGVIMATTHLFWHPKYIYERARQAGILVRETIKFRSGIGRERWPCIISGDFNFAPDDPAYSLLVGDPLLPDQEERLSSSCVVHVSIDPSVPSTTKTTTGEKGNDAATADPDKTVVNARLATPSDGLLSISELVALFSSDAPLRSAYDDGLRKYQTSHTNMRTFGDRVALSSTRCGAYEPEWTSYTHYWKTVLDYIFVLDPINCPSLITGLLTPHRTEDLQPGIPRKGISGSDHVSLSAELIWVDNRS